MMGSSSDGEHSGGRRKSCQTIARDRVAGEVVVHARILGVAAAPAGASSRAGCGCAAAPRNRSGPARPAASSRATGSTCARNSCDRAARPRSSVRHRHGRDRAPARPRSRARCGRSRASRCAATRSMKLPPSENPPSTIGMPAKLLRERAHRAHHFGQPAGMEQLAVEMMRGAVIAQVQAHDFEAAREQGLRQRQHVGGVGAAFPAMQQHGESLAGFAAALRGAGVKRLQRDAVAAFEQQFVARGAHGMARRSTRARRGGRLGRMVWKCGPRSQRRGRKELSSGKPVTAPEWQAAPRRARCRGSGGRDCAGAGRQRAAAARSAAGTAIAPRRHQLHVGGLARRGIGRIARPAGSASRIDRRRHRRRRR